MVHAHHLWQRRSHTVNRGRILSLNSNKASKWRRRWLADEPTGVHGTNFQIARVVNTITNKLSTDCFVSAFLKPDNKGETMFTILKVSEPQKQLFREKRPQFSPQLLAQQISCLLSPKILRAIFFQTSANYEVITQHWANECEKCLFWKSSVRLLFYFSGFCHSTKIEECFLPLNQLVSTLALPFFLCQLYSHVMTTLFIGCLAVCLRPR